MCLTLDLGLRPGQGYCVVFLEKTLNSHSSSHPGVQMDVNEFNDGDNPVMD